MPAPVETGLIDHDEVYIFVGGFRMKNRADGQYFSCSPTQDETIAQEGTDKSVVMIKPASGLWTASISLMPNARENDFLWGLAQTHRNTPGGFSFPLVVRHKRTNMLSATAMIARVPDITYSRVSADPKTWNFVLPNFDGAMGGFVLNTQLPIPADVAALLNP